MNIKSIHHAIAVALVCTSLVVCLPAHAQVAATKAAPAAPATPSATTPAATPAPAAVAPETRAAIKDLLEAMNMRDNLSKNFQGMTGGIAPQLAQAVARQVDANPSLTPEQKSKVLEGMKVPFDSAMKEVQGIITSPKLVDDTLQKMIPIYAKYYTTPEIKQLTAFYKSPLGAKTLSTMPQAIGETLQATFAELQPRLTGLMDKMLKTQIDAVVAKK